jgi:hypothetical protein
MEWQGIQWQDDDPRTIPGQIGTPQCALPDAGTIMGEAQTLYPGMYVGDIVMLYTTQRWIGYLKAGMMYFSNHDTALCMAIWKAHNAWVNDLYKEERPLAFASQEVMVTALSRLLHHEGWTCKTEHLTPYGRTDIFATHGARHAIIEVKLAVDGHTLKEALGQLLAYGFEHQAVELWLAVPRAIPAKFHTLFQHYNITIREVPCLK